MAKGRTIAVAYASVGSGHRIAAEAVAAELSGREIPGLRVELIDALESASPRLSGNALSSTFTGPTAGIYDALWSSEWAGAAGRTLGGPLLGSLFAGFFRQLEELSPDLVVCTHALASMVATRIARRADEPFSIVNVTTDFGVHSFWPRNGIALFCVADTDSRDKLVAHGVQTTAIAVTGVPVRQQFALDYDCDAARKHFGLAPDRRIVLALAGSTMPGPYERFKEALAVSLPALASLPGTSVVVVCGNDDLFAEEMRTRSAGFGTTNVQVLGYVEHMAPLMACADLALAKPGGSVCAECLAAGVPLVLIGPAAGQENANARALTDAGAALFAADPRTIAEYARKAISKPARLKKMRESASALARPFAAADITDRLLVLIGEPKAVEAD